jgi:hypothetical protein
MSNQINNHTKNNHWEIGFAGFNKGGKNRKIKEIDISGVAIINQGIRLPYLVRV